MEHDSGLTKKSMLKTGVYSLLLLFIFLGACTESNPAELLQNSASTLEQKEDSALITFTPIEYLDFKYSKAIAFVDANRFVPHFSSRKILDLSTFKDTISRTLNVNEISLLDSILSGRHIKPYKIPANQSDSIAAGADCFNPRHYIVFLDKEDHVLHYIAVCYECGRMESSKKELAGMNVLRNFFDHLGLKTFDRPDYHSQYYDSLLSSKKRSRKELSSNI